MDRHDTDSPADIDSYADAVAVTITVAHAVATSDCGCRSVQRDAVSQQRFIGMRYQLSDGHCDAARLPRDRYGN